MVVFFQRLFDEIGRELAFISSVGFEGLGPLEQNVEIRGRVCTTAVSKFSAEKYEAHFVSDLEDLVDLGSAEGINQEDRGH